ncbi:MAG TPA: hypothetical protein VF791_14790 [Pyrinomonadaceae bacterium]
MLRAAALSLLILVSVAVTLPLVDSSAHNNGRPHAGRRNRMNRRHSRAWWRRYRARLRRQREALRRRRAAQRANRGQSLNSMADSHKSAASYGKIPAVTNFKNAVAAPNLALPGGWARRATANGDMKFVIGGQGGSYAGEATLAVVNVPRSGELLMPVRGQRRSLAGVALTDLRRTVIDKMIISNGWVVNDIQREIEGKQVFIVLAQTAASSDGRTPKQSWVFFFTEVEGRIYSLAANASSEFADRLANEAAQLISSFHANSALAQPPQR